MLIRSAAKAIIRRESDGTYLMLTSSKWEENPRRSQQPDLPGGLVEEGETIEEGLHRELVEEIGVDTNRSSYTLVHAATWVEEQHQRSTSVLFYFIRVEDLAVTLSWEHEAYAWLTAEEVMNLEIRDPYPDIFKHFQRVGLLT